MTGSNKFWSIVYSIVLILQTFYWLQPHEVEDRLFFNVVYFHIDSIILTFFRSTSEVGIYGFAYKVFD